MSMTLPDLMIALIQASSGDNTARSVVCRQLAVAFPLIAWTPGEGDVIIQGRGVHGLDLRLQVVKGPPESDTCPPASESGDRSIPPPPKDPHETIDRGGLARLPRDERR